jgi:hypothetical protein
MRTLRYIATAIIVTAVATFGGIGSANAAEALKGGSPNLSVMEKLNGVKVVYQKFIRTEVEVGAFKQVCDSRKSFQESPINTGPVNSQALDTDGIRTIQVSISKRAPVNGGGVVANVKVYFIGNPKKETKDEAMALVLNGWSQSGCRQVGGQG